MYLRAYGQVGTQRWQLSLVLLLLWRYYSCCFVIVMKTAMDIPDRVIGAHSSGFLPLKMSNNNVETKNIQIFFQAVKILLRNNSHICSQILKLIVL